MEILFIVVCFLVGVVIVIHEVERRLYSEAGISAKVRDVDNKFHMEKIVELHKRLKALENHFELRYIAESQEEKPAHYETKKKGFTVNDIRNIEAKVMSISPAERLQADKEAQEFFKALFALDNEVSKKKKTVTKRKGKKNATGRSK